MKVEIPIPEPLQKILQILHDAGGRPRIVGGSVRDAILKIHTSDIDVITPLEPQSVTDILTEHGILVKDTGIKYGTVTAFMGKAYMQITTLRLDKECDGRHVNAEFTDDFEADAKRRDFTINSLSYCPFEHKLYDYTGGYDDLMAGLVVFIGDPTQRIEEDFLRILRFFRFSDKFARKIDTASLDGCIKLKKGLLKLSKERILMEMTKIMESPTCHKILDIMIQNDILKEIIPLEFVTDLLADINENAPDMLKVNEIVRFSALIYKNESSLLARALYDMKFSARAIDNITSLVKFREENPKIYEQPFERIKSVFSHLWVDNILADSYMLISECWKNKYFESLYKMAQLPPPKFPINGNDLVQKGLEGQAIKRELERLKNMWINSDFTLHREELLRNV